MTQQERVSELLLKNPAIAKNLEQVNFGLLLSILIHLVGTEKAVDTLERIIGEIK